MRLKKSRIFHVEKVRGFFIGSDLISKGKVENRLKTTAWMDKLRLLLICDPTEWKRLDTFPYLSVSHSVDSTGKRKLEPVDLDYLVITSYLQGFVEEGESLELLGI